MQAIVKRDNYYRFRRGKFVISVYCDVYCGLQLRCERGQRTRRSINNKHQQEGSKHLQNVCNAATQECSGAIMNNSGWMDEEKRKKYRPGDRAPKCHTAVYYSEQEMLC